MKSIKIILLGIVLLLASLFFMGLCIINHGKYDLISLTLFILGIIVSFIGIFFIPAENQDNDEEDTDEDTYD